MKLARRTSKTKGVILVGGSLLLPDGVSKFTPFNDQMQILHSKFTAILNP
jgi:hypothetical protein